MIKPLLLLLFITQAQAGDAIRGEILFKDHRTSLCLLCHEHEKQERGNLAPSLNETKLSANELRERIIDMRKFNPQTLMPPFHSSEGLRDVHQRFLDKPILTLEQIDDLVAYLGRAK